MLDLMQASALAGVAAAAPAHALSAATEDDARAAPASSVRASRSPPGDGNAVVASAVASSAAAHRS